MNKELSRPIMRAIVALVLIIIVKLAAMVILIDIEIVYPVVDILLSLVVVTVLLRLRKELNTQLENSSPNSQNHQSIVSGIILLLVIFTLYGTFIHYSYILPYGFYQLIFFFLALFPIYSLWNILNKNSDRLSDFFSLILYEEKTKCTCGWENPHSAKYCNSCGSSIKEK
jgi:hypothetical protein